MRFLTWCNKIDERSELLFKSAKHFGIELEPIGLGKEYRGGASKIEWLLDCLKSEKFHPAEDIVAVDAFDSLFVRNPGENELHWELSECRFPILYSGERNYSKRPPELQGYFSVVHDIITEGCYTPYVFPNGGGVMANSPGSLREFMELASEIPGDEENTEQWKIAKAFAASGKECVQVDYECSVFYCCGGEWRRFAGEVVDGRFRNKRTGTYPYILHAPQWRRSQGIRERVAKELGII